MWDLLRPLEMNSSRGSCCCSTSSRGGRASRPAQQP
jgi:hypothetical protein